MCRYRRKSANTWTGVLFGGSGGILEATSLGVETPFLGLRWSLNLFDREGRFSIIKPYILERENEPRSGDPSFVFLHSDDIFPHRLSASCSYCPTLIVVEERWDFAISTDMFLSRESSRKQRALTEDPTAERLQTHRVTPLISGA